MTAPVSAPATDPWKLFHDFSWADLWSPGRGSWLAGVWTGPQADLICLKKCDTNAEANEWLSPSGPVPKEAIRLAAEKRIGMAAGRSVCERCGAVGWEPVPEKYLMGGWCTGCWDDLNGDGRTDGRYAALQTPYRGWMARVPAPDLAVLIAGLRGGTTAALIKAAEEELRARQAAAFIELHRVMDEDAGILAALGGA